VWCWGGNDAGQVGSNPNTFVSTPELAHPSLNAIDVSAGGAHTCALSATRQIRCWGSNASGQTGPVAKGDPVLLDGRYLALATELGPRHSCALSDVGEAVCWGDNADGQLGDGRVWDLAHFEVAAVVGEAEGRAWQAEGWMDVAPERRQMRWGSDALVYYKGELQVTGQHDRCQVELRLHLVPLPHVAARMVEKSGSVEAGLKHALERTLESIRQAVEGSGPMRGKQQPGAKLVGRGAMMKPESR
jgi:hypothetical protein